MKIHTIDQEFLGTPQVIASYLVEAPEGNILIETGPASTQAVLEGKIQDLGFSLDSVVAVLVSHIHLDHSGGAGYWAQRGAEVHVHPKGARHLIEPDRLLASAQRIYQDRMDILWGKTLPCPADTVHPWEGSTKTIAGLEVTAHDTPGHASHHLAFQIEDQVFTGDVGGVRLPGSPYVSVPAPPPEFDLLTWLSSLDRLLALKPNRLYLTHFGAADNAVEHLETLKRRLQLCTDFVTQQLEQQSEIDLKVLERSFQKWEREQALSAGLDPDTYEAYEKANPSFMSAQGIARYWFKLNQCA